MATCITESQKQVLLYGTTLNAIKKETQVNARSRLSKVMKKRNVDRIIRGKNPTKFKQHMSKSHPDQYAQLLDYTLFKWTNQIYSLEVIYFT